ncbi:hypothetical protein GF373_05215 [bacterium]|nr:hypothetical protein [bacterium]
MHRAATSDGRAIYFWFFTLPASGKRSCVAGLSAKPSFLFFEGEKAKQSLEFTGGYRWIFLGLFALAITGWIGSIYLIWDSSQPGGNPTLLPYALYGWIGFLVLLLGTGYREIAAWWRTISWQAAWPLLGLLFLSLFLGMYQLTQVPATVHGDEGKVGEYAREIAAGDIATFFSYAWYSLPQFFFAVPAGGLVLFGDSLFGLRMSSVLLGSLSVVPLYLVMRKWWGEFPAILAGMMLITNHWFLFLQHSGVSYVQGCFFASLLLCLWDYANAKRSLGLLAWAGIVLGLGLISYQVNQILPFLWIASQVGLWCFRRIDGKWFLVSVGLPLCIAGMVISPWVAREQAVKNVDKAEIDMFSKRMEGVVIWSDMNSKHLNHAYETGGDYTQVIREQLKRAFWAPVYYADTSMQYHGERPFLDRVAAVFFMLSVFVGCYRLFDYRFSIPLLWGVGILLTGGVMTVDAPFYPRLVGLTGLLFILIGGLFSSMWQTAVKNALLKKVGFLFLAACVVFSSHSNLTYFFGRYANEVSPRNPHYAQTRMARWIDEQDPRAFIYVFPGTYLSFGSGTVKFMAKDHKGGDMRRIPNQWKKPPFHIIIDAGRRPTLFAIQKQFPRVEREEHRSALHDLLFYTLSIE